MGTAPCKGAAPLCGLDGPATVELAPRATGVRPMGEAVPVLGQFTHLPFKLAGVIVKALLRKNLRKARRPLRAQCRSLRPASQRTFG